jgi:hypothetical protein
MGREELGGALARFREADGPMVQAHGDRAS